MLKRLTLLLLLFVLTACGGGKSAETDHSGHGDSHSGHSDAGSAVTEKGDLAISNVRASLTLPTSTGVIWMDVTNNGDADETLQGATVDGCETIEIHDMVMQDGDMMMQQLENNELTIPAGETVKLERGGLHVMCMGKTGEFATGRMIDVSLDFANAGTVVAAGEVVAPDGGGMSDMDHGDDGSHGNGHDDSHDGDHVSAIIPNDGATIDILAPTADDSVSGDLTVQVVTTGFDLMGEGNHWHLYINGDLMEKVKGSDSVTLSDLPAGEHMLRVAMSTPDHEEMEDGAEMMLTIE